MALDNCTCPMGCIIMELFLMGMPKAKVDSSIKAGPFMKDKSGTTSPKEKAYWLMISKNIAIWEVGSMICPMEKGKRFGAMEPITKENSSMAKSTEKGNTSLQMDAFMKAHSSMINLMARDISRFLKENTKVSFSKELFTVKVFLDGKMAHLTKVITKMTKSMASVNISIEKEKVFKAIGKTE